METEKACYQFHLRRGEAGGDTVETKRDSDNPVKKVASTIEAWKVICGLIVALVAAVVSDTIYVSGFSTTEAVETKMDNHVNSDGHPSLSRGMQDISNRLLRVEITQGAMVKAQEGMDAKLDRILSVIPLVRLPAYQPVTPAQPDL